MNSDKREKIAGLLCGFSALVIGPAAGFLIANIWFGFSWWTALLVGLPCGVVLGLILVMLILAVDDGEFRHHAIHGISLIVGPLVGFYVCYSLLSYSWWVSLLVGSTSGYFLFGLLSYLLIPKAERRANEAETAKKEAERRAQVERLGQADKALGWQASKASDQEISERLRQANEANEAQLRRLASGKEAENRKREEQSRQANEADCEDA